MIEELLSSILLLSFVSMGSSTSSTSSSSSSSSSTGSSYISSTTSIPTMTMPTTQPDTSWSILPTFVTKLYHDCERKEYDLLDCLKIKSISLLDRIGRSEVIELDDSIKLVREGRRSDGARALTENDIETSIIGTYEKSSMLNQMLFDKISKFAGSHVLKIGLPKIDVPSIARGLSEGMLNLFCL